MCSSDLLGLGAGHVGPRDVTVAVDEAGGAHAVLAGAAARAAEEGGVREVALSLSFTREVAVANAVAVTDDVRPQRDEGDAQARELARSFREARGLIDELERVEAGQGQLPLAQAGVADELQDDKDAGPAGAASGEE